MKVAVGTQNKGKIQAVRNALIKYEQYTDALVEGIDVDTGVSAQPMSLDETLVGAKNRAKQAYLSGEYNLAIGLESGLFPVPHTKSGYLDTCACAIYDGQQFHIGLSSCFEYPKVLLDKVIGEGKEITDAAIELGFFEDASIREQGGMIGILTKNVLPRTTYSEQAVHTAMLHLLNREHY